METCRSCLTESDLPLMFSLLEPVLQSNFLEFTSVMVTADDTVSTMLCLICKHTLELFGHFKARTITSDRFLKERSVKHEHFLESEVTFEDEKITAPLSKRKRVPNRKYADSMRQKNSDLKPARCSESTPEPEEPDPPKPEIDPICDDNSVTEIELPFYEKIDAKTDEIAPNEPTNVFICSECPRRFPKITGLKRHQKVHLNRKLVCDDCGKLFSCRESLLTHKRHVHLQLRPFKCPDCGTAFKNKSGMLEHCRNLHSTERNFICEICSGTFKTQNRLNSHIKSVHVAQKVIKCPECDLQVKNKHVLTTHYRNLHTNIRPFICYLCDRGFGLKNSLEKHMKIHLNGKFKRREFRCDLCDKMFVSTDTLRDHKRKLHPSAWAARAQEPDRTQSGEEA